MLGALPILPKDIADDFDKIQYGPVWPEPAAASGCGVKE
jgi:hypothetical protein